MSPYSNVATVFAPPELVAPAEVNLSRAGNGVNISWPAVSAADRSPPVQGYKVSRMVEDEDDYTDLGDASGTSFTDTAPVQGKTLYYEVAAFDELGRGKAKMAWLSSESSGTRNKGPFGCSTAGGLHALGALALALALRRRTPPRSRQRSPVRGRA